MVCFRMILMTFCSNFQNFYFDGWRLLFSCKVKLSLNTNLVAHQPRAYLGFCSIKRLGVFSLPSRWDASPSQGYPNIKFAGAHLYTWVERGTVRAKCPAQEHNTVPLARAQTLAARSGIWPPASHRCCINCIRQMPKHWWTSGASHLLDVNDYLLKRITHLKHP